MKPRRSLSGAAWLAIAASIVAAASLGYLALLYGRVSILRMHTVVLERQLAVITAPDAVRVDLKGQGDASAASGRAFVSRAHGVFVSADGLPPPGSGRVYRFWVVTDRAALSAGLLDVNTAGSVAATLTLPATTAPFLGVSVTIEPENGITAPTGPTVLSGLIAR